MLGSYLRYKSLGTTEGFRIEFKNVYIDFTLESVTQEGSREKSLLHGPR